MKNKVEVKLDVNTYAAECALSGLRDSITRARRELCLLREGVRKAADALDAIDMDSIDVETPEPEPR